MAGPGLLVVDIADRDATDVSQTYVVGVSDAAVGLARGGDLPTDGCTVCGRVLFCCRPPARGAEAAPIGADGSSMMQL